MKLEHSNSSGEIVLTIKVNPIELFVLKKCENWAKNKSYKNPICYFFEKMLCLLAKQDALYLLHHKSKRNESKLSI